MFFLGETYTLLNFDSLETKIGIKKTFGMNLVNLLWRDISYGQNELIDLHFNRKISAMNSKTYSIMDSIEVLLYDSAGNAIGSTKHQGH